MKPTSMWNKRTYAVVTGASRGIGRGIAIELGRRYIPQSVVVLLARSMTGLQETRDLVLAANPTLQVHVFTVDLGRPDKVFLEKMLEETAGKMGNFEAAMMVHNAGSLGDLSKPTAELDSLEQWQDYFTFNVFSMVTLTSVFCKIFTSEMTSCQRLILNITSLCAIQPFKNFAHYCTGKASREMYLKVLALEDPSLQILNYSPGPVQTDMADAILDGLKCAESKATFETLRQNGGYLTTEQTVARMIEVLNANKFKSGDHVDYYDEI